MKLKYIDSIRGIAILMVILVHTSQEIDGLRGILKIVSNYGQMGVQLFFIASAYTLCLSASRNINESQPLFKYAIRRYFRIAPLYYVGILGYFLLSLILSISNNREVIIPAQYSFKNIASNLLFLHGFYRPGNNNIVPGGWSIGTEMAFYVVFPILYLIASKSQIKSFRNIILFILAGLVFSQIFLFNLSLKGTLIENNNFLYYNLINQITVFILGIGYYSLNLLPNLKHRWKIDLFGFIFFTYISIFLWRLNINYLFSLIPFVSGLSFVFLMEIFRKNELLNRNIIVKIGKLSYSMYIIHFIFAHTLTGMIASRFVNHFGSEISLLTFYIISICGSYYFATLTEKYVEKPFIDFGKRIISGIKSNDYKKAQMLKEAMNLNETK
jgi:peptidoglycan/LPS O-acetylase OafA/YrhL